MRMWGMPAADIGRDGKNIESASCLSGYRLLLRWNAFTGQF
jgi:hypothetical protein